MANPSLLLLPADIAAVAVIDRHVAAAADAAGQLELAPAPKSLHNFRVALRRLRALLKAHDPWLGDTFPKVCRHSLRNLAHRSNPQRDLDVQIAWLGKMRNTASLQPGHRQLLALLTTQTGVGPGQGHSLAMEFRAIHRALEEHRLTTPAPRGEGVVYGRVLAKQLAKAERRFTRQLTAVLGGDRDQLHGARIAGKSLRYLVETLTDLKEDTRPLRKPLKELQDTLGKLHDCRVFAAALPALAEQLVADWQRRGTVLEDSPLAGIDGIARRLAKREKTLWRSLATRANNGDLKHITAAARRLRKRLKTLAGKGAPHCKK